MIIRDYGVEAEQHEEILSTYSRFSSSNRDVCFVLLEMMLVGVICNIEVYTSSKEKKLAIASSYCWFFTASNILPSKSFSVLTRFTLMYNFIQKLIKAFTM